jgi:hypothetical protein
MREDVAMADMKKQTTKKNTPARGRRLSALEARAAANKQFAAALAKLARWVLFQTGSQESPTKRPEARAIYSGHQRLGPQEGEAIMDWNVQDYEFIADTGQTVRFDRDAMCCMVQLPPDLNDPGEIRALGSGFYLLTNRLVVTAKHIFTCSDENYGPIFTHNLAPNGAPGLAGFLAIQERVYLHPVADLAIVLLAEDQSPPMRPFLPEPHDHLIKSDLFTVGYKPSQSKLTTGGWDVTIDVNLAALHEIEARERRDHVTEYCIVFATEFGERGNSGGPVLSKSGKVIGVISELYAETSDSDANVRMTMARATSIKPVIDLIASDPFLASLATEIGWLLDKPKRG